MSNLCKFEAMKQLLADSGTYYVICIDNDGNYSYVNDHYAQRFGHVQESFIGQPYDVTIHPDDIRIFEELSGKCYASPDKLFPTALRIANGKGGFMITQWDITLMTKNGSPVGVFCIGHDAAEYEQVRNKYFLINNDKEAKTAIEDAIAYEQSHIARAPLANILGLINVLKNYQYDPEAEVIMNMLQQSCVFLDDVVKSIAKKPVA